MNFFLSTLAIAVLGTQASVLAFQPDQEYFLYSQGKNPSKTCRMACVVAIEPELAATIIPSRLQTRDHLQNLLISHPSPEKDNQSSTSGIPAKLVSRELLTGLVLLKPDTPLPSPAPKIIDSSELPKEASIIYKSPSGELINGIYVGTEHSSSGINFPLPLLRVQFPSLKTPLLGQACYTNKGELAGLIIGTTPKGVCQLLPAEAILNLAKNPDAKRARLGCLLDINGSVPEVIGLVEGGPMQKAGVKTGDVIISINGMPVDSYKDFLRIAYYLPSRSGIDLKIVRDNNIMEIKGIMLEEGER